MTTDVYLTITELGRKVKRSRAATYNDLNTGRLPQETIRLGARGRRWLESEVDAHLARLAQAQREQ